MKCQTCVAYCRFCEQWRLFYRYADGASRAWICQGCARERA